MIGKYLKNLKLQKDKFIEDVNWQQQSKSVDKDEIDINDSTFSSILFLDLFSFSFHTFKTPFEDALTIRLKDED